MEAKDCYEYELIGDNDTNREQYGELFNEVVGTYKLTTFKGFEENGEPKTECGVSKEGLYYSVIVPSKIKDEQGNELEVSTLGNNLFNAIEGIGSNGPTLNKNQLIKEININEGIKIIDDGNVEENLGTFAFIGYGINDTNYNLNINLTNTLNYICDLAFMGSSLNVLKIPYSVKSIGIYACQGCQKLSKLIFEMNNGLSNLNEIGDNAFEFCDLNYTSPENSLYLPNSIIVMGNSVFRSNTNLSYIYFEGDETGFGSSWNGNATLLPLRD